MIDNVLKTHKHVKAVATTLREVHSTNRHSWSAVAWVEGRRTRPDGRPRRSGSRWRWRRICRWIHLRAVERRDAAGVGKLGWAHGALLTTFPGDTTMATVEQVRAFAQGGSARIQR